MAEQREIPLPIFSPEYTIDVAEGNVRWYVKPYGKGRIVLTMQSEARPSTWLAMHMDRDGLTELTQAAFRQLERAEND